MLGALKKQASKWRNFKTPKLSKTINPDKVEQGLKKVWTSPDYFIAFGFGSGLARTAPGTFGTLAAIPIYLLINNFPPLIYLAITVIFFIFGVYISNKVSIELGVQDYKGIVWDEIVGYLFVMFLAPTGVLWMLLGFLLFRLFDIWKPEPIGWIDRRVKGGFGIMLDDFVAAIFAWILLQLIVWIF
ncbi:MAG: phosphatidylglycerophosphatase A [Legionellaceae bacterium]|nr:phosphatidylglycerophosphatase A [Legionellaceae bacterium]